jgi:cysteinyl-tRNA synthetase
LKLFNSLTDDYCEIKGNIGNTIRIYLCGITVYDDCHIGHARTIVVFDILRRYLSHKGLRVIFVQNFTDVDDKIISKARKEGAKADEISQKYIDRYFSDFSRLNVIKADFYPKATDHIPDMLTIIGELLRKDIAYQTQNGIYFRIKKFTPYGKLSKKTLGELESGSRIEIDSLKSDPLDFALWKFSQEEPVWNSPWGSGRPGWHIECSAMALKYLGSEIEIHGGGQDLIFPHHENEIAQSESYSNKIFSKLWMHVGLVTLNAEKMSKSIGNIMSVREALTKYGPNTLRLYLLNTHYSKPLDYSDSFLIEASQKWKQIENSIFELRAATGSCEQSIDKSKVDKILSEFEAAMENNLNTSLALSSVLKLASMVNRLSSLGNLTRGSSRTILPIMESMLEVLGLEVLNVPDVERIEIERLIEVRNKLRKEKRYQESDEIRKNLYDTYGIELVDHTNYTNWKKIENSQVGKRLNL